MDAEYDRKFEEMKKYIPFLESMIKRLENSSASSNPRQAQLDKIRSLRDLLLDKRKRMKMENLLKCEQVLVNLYAKVEQRGDDLKGKIDDITTTKKEKNDLSAVRSKLKSVVSKLQPELTDTLPEIARANETEELCVPGSKEPALFQRRPHLSSTSSGFSSSTIKENPTSKRNYTRVLVSPEPYLRSDTSSESPLYHRRSPKKSPRKPSPFHRKERKKSKNKYKHNESKMNITLNVPEDSLNSLNTEDILSRIINCSDTDVDIATLRELRTQILGELKDTGANDDISDIILKSYKNKKMNKAKGAKKKSEVEDGEISDSESEAIESIYGSLVVIDKNKSASTENKVSDKDKPRKIQICLVINSDKTKPAIQEDKNSCVDKSDFETFSQKEERSNTALVAGKTTFEIEQNNYDDAKYLDDISNDSMENKSVSKILGPQKETKATENMDTDFETFSQKEERSNTALVAGKTTSEIEQNNYDDAKYLDDISNDSMENESVSKILGPQKETKATENMDTLKNERQIEEINLLSPEIQEKEESEEIGNSKKVEIMQPNFYKPLVEQVEEIKNESKKITESRKSEDCSKLIPDTREGGSNSTNDNSEIQIPLLEPTKPILEPSKEVSEIDILQALKKEILNETTNVLKTDTTAALSTPLLHQPKITKVANAKEIGPKKRISIESYKAKANTPMPRPSKSSEDLFIGKNTTKDESSRKQSLKLTEKECERFNFLSKLTLTESSDDEDKSSLSLDDIYTDLAPKSPDHEDFADTGLKPPVIIPSDPVQTPVVCSETDVDMRILTPNIQASNLSNTPLLSPLYEKPKDANTENDLSKSDEKAAIPLVDPRVKRDVASVPNKDTLKLKPINVEKIQSPSSSTISSPVVSNASADHTQTSNSTIIPSLLSLNIPPVFPNMTPSRTPNTAPNMTPRIPLLMTPSRTPNIPNMTPSRTPIVASMTPSRHTFDNEDFSTRKHVYAPMFSDMDSRDDMEKSRENHQTQWNASDSRPSFWEDRRNCSVQRDIDYRELRRDIDYRDHSMPRDLDYRRSHSVQRDVDYRETRNSSVHSFDQREYPTTPSHPFGRLDCPPTPIPSFGRLDCPSTPNSSFGRLDCPPTPNPSFGRIDRPMTPVHPFGRSDCPLTPSHPFGRGEQLHPVSNFGRSEYPRGSRSQDPRLNRTSDYDTYQYGDDDQERTYIHERKVVSGSYNIEHQSRDSFRRYRQERSVGRYDRNKNLEPIQTHQDHISRRENSVGPPINREHRGDRGRSVNRNHEGDTPDIVDKRFSRYRNRGKGYDYRNQNDSKNYDDGGRLNFQRERSVGRTHEPSIPIQDRRSHPKFLNENKLRVNPLGGPSFTIDTSITSSFQEINVNRKNRSSFDARRQRAASVCRSLLSISRTRDAFNNPDKKNRDDNKYRRACSVGREVAESKLNFKDTKADLKSFKFKSDYRFSKSTECIERRVSTESSRKFGDHCKQKAGEVYDKFSKYSPRKNNRDPRIRRESSRDNKDYKRSPQDSNNYGMVYTSDNISKGTILHPGYGVRNYKIPKIKRPQEELVTMKPTDDVGDKNKTDLKDKDVEVTLQSEQQSEHNLEQKSTLSKTIRSKSTNLNNADKKELADDYRKKLNEDSFQNENEKCETNEIQAKKNVENCISENVTINNERTEFSSDSTIKNPEETKEDEMSQNLSDSLDSTERRVTRSARKSMPIEPISLELSPIKRTRKAKKSLVVESDSEDNEMLSKSNLNLYPQTVTTKEHLSEQTSLESPGKRATKKGIVNSESNIPGNITDKPVSTVLETNKRETHLDVFFSESTIREQEFDSRNNDKLMNYKLDETNKNADDVLNSNFGLSDLEMFSDNLASDPVIDNINSLIADLDHDLDSSKNSDANSQFTKELNLETMLENISSVDENEENDVIQDDVGEIKNSKVESNILHPIILSEDKIEENILEKSHISQENSDSNKTDMIMNDNMQKSDILQNKPHGLEVSISKKSTSDKIEDCQIQQDFTDQDINISYPQSCDQSEKITKPDVEDACSNDAVVSTSEDGNVFITEKSLQNIPKNETAYSPIPDSTINSNGDDNGQKNILISESACEMNSDITSTHVSDAAAKDSEEVFSDVGTSKEVQSLLSLLEDDTKIKELLSKIGDSKIKKKLEMLSERLNEIVSEDESTAENNSVENRGATTFDVGTAENNLVENQEQVKFDANTIKHNCNETQAREELHKKVHLDSNSQNVQVIRDINNDESKSDKQDKENNMEENADELVKKVQLDSNSYKNVQEIRDISNVESKSDKEDKEKNTEENSSFDKKCTDPIKTLSAEIAEVIVKNSEQNIYCDTSSVKVTENNREDEEKILEPSACNDEKDLHNLTSEKKKPPVKRGKRRKGKKWCKKPVNTEEKRITRSGVVTNLQPLAFQSKSVKKKPSRELTQLQKDIGEMFIKDDVLSATGIRMCRLAKLIDEKKSTEDAQGNESNSQEPLVVLNKFSDLNESEKSVDVDKMNKKKILKGKNKDVDGNDLTDKTNNTNKTDTVLEQDSKLKSKVKRRGSLDPYVFETDSVNELNDVSDSKNNSSSESESDSVGSTKSSESTEIMETKKKVKRRRVRLWQVGVIKPKNKKKKDQNIIASTSTDDISETDTRKVPDRNYCFRKNVSNYNCRICSYSGTDIVHHYKKEHPHTEVLISRPSPAVAKQAIKESENVNFQEVSRISSKKYVCRFCFKEFSRQKLLLETFFWHIVSMHTGEYKQSCSKCVDAQICPMNTDIPPPPKDAQGQLLGHICELCNFTQISIENMKSHISGSHGDQEVPVYLINLANLSKSTMNRILNKSESTAAETERSRVLRSSRSNQSLAEISDDESDSSDGFFDKLNKRAKRKIETTSKSSHIQSKITFESDIADEISNFDASETTFKIEADTNIQGSHFDEPLSEPERHNDQIDVLVGEKPDQSIVSQDIFDYPHFKIKQSESGSKEYVCCINGKDNHYKTSLLISMKKHVQLKHSEQWDGYCYLCKVIVTSQGNHKFKECLQHFLDVHMDNFPILEEITVTREKLPETEEHSVSDEVPGNVETNKPFINVRPLSELLSTPSGSRPVEKSGPILPRIESVMSLGERVEQPRPSPTYPTPRTENVEVLKHYKYEEFQAEVMSRKHRVVLEGMMSQTKLVHVFKCAGRFCSFSTDNAEDALLHASTHIRVGGVDSLNCAYCDFDASGNAVDLITHVFKCHGSCPYVCGMCFYRAAASQLVKAHIQRVHDKATNVEILKTQFQPSAIQEDDILSREAAVPFYLCRDKNSSDVPCKYKTYTPGKFREHMESRHSSSAEFFCFICSTSAPTPAELIGHLETHGLKIYQCTWCVFGADNESQLLEHASALHPTRRPKAYLRIITNKEGSKDFRVLPLAHLHKSDVPVTEVSQIAQRDSPVREAERSIELEKLIGHMIESMTTAVETNVSESEQNTSSAPSEEPLQDAVSILENVETLMPRVNTPTPLAEQSTQIISEQTTPVIKAQSPVTTPNKLPQPEPEIVCLDSDDESPPIETNVPPPVPQNAQVTAPADQESKKVQFTELFMCSKCKVIFKTGSAFRNHVNSCFSGFPRDLIPCAHCSMWLPKRNIVSHYNSHCDKGADKTKEQIQFYCQICLRYVGFSSVDQVREHLVDKHNMLATEGSSLPPFIKSVAPGPKSRRKRVLEHKEKAVEPPEKVMRYGPHDIDKLPINPILDDFVVCSLCEFSTKVRLNMVRHLQLHAQQQPVPQTAPVNPVPHLETNERHFDKMVNLASSSIGTRYPDKSGKPDGAAAAATVPSGMLYRFPKYVPDKHRLTCGAKGCSYISVDESMLKCHWETLHHGVNDFHCVHCPPYQSLDTSVNVTAQRIILHLKMHDEKLYACSLCQYYHYRRQTLEKHLVEVHKGGQVMIVREGKAGECNSPTAANASLLKTSAPTMDLKPWQCGLCKFKSLLRPEVVDHCAKVHNSKIQFKCAYCAYRASNPEYITNHQTKSHVGKKVDEIFYYYYREGSIPDEPDGTTRWQKQSQNTPMFEPKVKSELQSDVDTAAMQVVPPQGNPAVPTIDLDVVKKEVEPVQETIEDLCKEFGAFCEPNGIKYKCSLCNNATEDSLEAMQSHLYEELQYRKWGCSICPYKAFHKGGLNDHMLREHRQNRDPIALPVNTRVETWVAKLLEHQTSLISKYKANLAKQKEEILRTNPGSSPQKSKPQQAKESPAKTLNTPNTPDATELEKTFGPFGAASDLNFCCPKCNSSFKDEDIMHSHLESELNRIRWYCSNCQMKFQTYHEAQFHSRSVHAGQSARPIEATRDPAVRAAWIDAVIRAQKQSMDVVAVPTTEKTFHRMEDMSEEPENSLLAVLRYEKSVPTLEEEVARRTPVSAMDSDDERLVIDEPLENRVTKISHKCSICNFASHSAKFTRAHVLRHYGLKPFMCPYCNLYGMRKTIEKHQNMVHPALPINLVPTPVPDEPPSEYLKKAASAPGPSETTAVKLICLVCRNSFTETESLSHSHAGTLCVFGKKGDVVVHCNACRSLHKDVAAYTRHKKTVHPELLVDYLFIKLNTASMESKELVYACDNCPQKFSLLRDIKSHSEANHASVLKYTLVPKHSVPEGLNESEASDRSKRKSEDDSILPPSKRTARKSTTKLPSSTVARKSTTKLPCNVRCETVEFSYYGTKPQESYDGVVTMMPFCNKMVPFTFEKLKEIINIDPVVRVEKL